VIRRVALVCALAVLGLLSGAASPAWGAGATYTVVQCDALNRSHQATLAANLAYDARSFCPNSAQEHSIQVNNTASAGHSRFGTASWLVPSSALGIVAVDVEGKLRRDHGHRSRLYMADDDGNETIRVATGDTGPTGFDHHTWSGVRQEAFVANLSCGEPDGCPQSDLAKTWVRSVELTLADYADPAFGDVSGSLVDGGWLRGSHGLFATASDAGSGTTRVVTRVNGTELAFASGSCLGIAAGTSLANRLSPCSAGAQLARSAVNTAESPFADGPNAVSVCAMDFAGNETCESRTVQIDNTRPALGFANSQDPRDPDLIRAPVSDTHSGIASGHMWFRPVGFSTWQPLETTIESGELRARIDSAAEPAGEYEFMAEATDVAGNHVETTRKQNGQEMQLTFPLRAGVELTANLEPGGARRQTVAYGRDSRVAGRLFNTEGTPLRNQDVTVVEYFGEGALIDRRIRTVTTDAQGRWSSKLPAGPSRTVTAHFGGDSRYLAAQQAAGTLQVRSNASFRTSRSRIPEGERIVFKGKVGHVGARIPIGGKLIELQVREGADRWNTVREAFYTKPNGRYRLAYRFGRFYLADAVFRFRAKVAREQGWPYKAPAQSRSRRVTVLAR
jgi:type II secretory pathway pseudopilin PulG